MSHSSFNLPAGRWVEKLLDLSADQAGGVEVEWVALGSVADIGTGSSNRQDENKNGAYPFYVRSKNILKSDTFEFDEVAIVIPGEGGIGEIFHYVEGKYALHQRAYRIYITSDVVNTKFLYHFMTSSFKQYILMKSVGATAISIRKPMLEEFYIPIPCPENPKKSLEIQAEIVRILDNFTELTAELTAQKKQYNYYRDKLLSFEEREACLSGREVEWKTLGEVATLITKGTTPKVFTDSGINFIKLESFDGGRINIKKCMFISPDIHTKELKRSVLQANDVLFAIAGATIGKCAIVEKSILPANTNQALAIIRLSDNVNVKFVFYYMQTVAMKKYIAKFNKTSAQPNLNLQQMASFGIPIPKLAEQERIVAILDKFDALTNSITEGLPREIALRQKQYEYYRDLLLSFPKVEEAA